MDDLFVDHDLKAALFWANLKNLIRSVRVAGWTWTSERDIRARKRRVKDPETDRWLRVLPDAEFKVRYHDGALQWAFVEIDMGTLTLNRFRQKMRAFDLYAGALKNKGGDAAEAGFDVYVLALSEGRMQQLRQATEREIGEGRWVDHYFATFDVLEPTQFGECSWLGSDGTWYQLLYEQAYARPEAAAGSPTRPVEKPKSVAGGQ